MADPNDPYGLGLKPYNSAPTDDPFGLGLKPYEPYRPPTPPPAPHKGYEAPEPSWTQWGIANALETVPGIAGTIGGGILGSVVPVVGTGWGAAGGGAAGSALGNTLRQWYEMNEGLRGPDPEFNYGEMGVEGGLGAINLFGKIPGAKAGSKELMKFAMKAPLSGAAEAGLVGFGGAIPRQLAQTGELPTMGDALKQGLMSAPFGFAAGTALGSVPYAMRAKKMAGIEALNGIPPPTGIPGGAPPGLVTPPTGPAADPNFNQGQGDPNLAGTTPYPRGPGGPTQTPTVPPQAQSPTGPDLSGSVEGGRIKLSTLPDGSTVATVMRPEAEVPFLRQNGYVPWVDHRSPDGWPQMIRHAQPLPSGEAPPVPPPVQPAQAAQAGDDSVSINADGTAMVPRAKLSTLLINRLREQGMEMFGRDSEGNGFFRQLMQQDERGSVDPRIFNPMEWRSALQEQEGVPRPEAISRLQRMFRPFDEAETQAATPAQPIRNIRQIRNDIDDFISAHTPQSASYGRTPTTPPPVDMNRLYQLEDEAIESLRRQTDTRQASQTVSDMESDVTWYQRNGIPEGAAMQTRIHAAAREHADILHQQALEQQRQHTEQRNQFSQQHPLSSTPATPQAAATPSSGNTWSRVRREFESERHIDEDEIRDTQNTHEAQSIQTAWFRAIDNYGSQGDESAADYARMMTNIAGNRVTDFGGTPIYPPQALASSVGAPSTGSFSSLTPPTTSRAANPNGWSRDRQFLEQSRTMDEQQIRDSTDIDEAQATQDSWEYSVRYYQGVNDLSAADYAIRMMNTAGDRVHALGGTPTHPPQSMTNAFNAPFNPSSTNQPFNPAMSINPLTGGTAPPSPASLASAPPVNPATTPTSQQTITQRLDGMVRALHSAQSSVFGDQSQLAHDMFTDTLHYISQETDPNIAESNRLAVENEYNFQINGGMDATALQYAADLLEAARSRVGELRYSQPVSSTQANGPAVATLQQRLAAGQISMDEYTVLNATNAPHLERLIEQYENRATRATSYGEDAEAADWTRLRNMAWERHQQMIGGNIPPPAMPTPPQAPFYMNRERGNAQDVQWFNDPEDRPFTRPTTEGPGMAEDLSAIRQRQLFDVEGQQGLPGFGEQQPFLPGALQGEQPIDGPPPELERLVNFEAGRQPNPPLERLPRRHPEGEYARLNSRGEPSRLTFGETSSQPENLRQTGLVPFTSGFEDPRPQKETVAGRVANISDEGRAEMSDTINVIGKHVRNLDEEIDPNATPEEIERIKQREKFEREDAERQWKGFRENMLREAPNDPDKPGLEVKSSGPQNHIIIFRSTDGKVRALAKLKPEQGGVMGVSYLAGDTGAVVLPDGTVGKGMGAGRGILEVLSKAVQLGAHGTRTSISPYTKRLLKRALFDYVPEGRNLLFGKSSTAIGPNRANWADLPDDVKYAQSMKENRGMNIAGALEQEPLSPTAQSFIQRLLGDEAGQELAEFGLLGPLQPFIGAGMAVQEGGKAIAKGARALKSAIGQRWSSAMEALNARNAPDEEYASVMPNSTRPLGSGETWKSRVEKGIEFFESKAAQEGVSQASATAPPTGGRGAAPFTEAQLQQAFIAAGIPPGGKPPGGKGGGGGLPGGKTPWFDKTLGKKPEERSYARQLYDFTRGGTTTGDLSAPFRQGLPLMFTKAWRDSWGTMMSSLGSDDAFKKSLSDIRQRPMFKRDIDLNTGKIRKSFAEQAGLELMEVQGRLSRREEGIASNWVETGEMFGKDNRAQRLYQNTAGRYAKATNRAYVSFLNQLRADTFESLMTDAEEAFKADTKAGNKGARNPRTDMTLAKEIADFVNTASGRGPLRMTLPSQKMQSTNIMGMDVNLPLKEYSAERAAHILTESLFSPRLVASRMRMLNPATYMMASPFVRKQYLKAATHTALAWGGMASAAAIMGAEVETDTQSADFGKIRIGNTRLDPAGGFQQYIVAFSRMMQGGYQSSSSGQEFEYGQGYRAETRGDALQRFGVNKLHPVLKFGNDILFASQRQPFNVADRTAQLFVPLIAQDMLELAKEDPKLLPLLGAMYVGMGSQTYDKGENEGRFLPPDYDFTFTGGSPGREFNNLPFLRD